MIQKIADAIWKWIEKIYSLPDDIFDLEDDQNAIIEEWADF